MSLFSIFLIIFSSAFSIESDLSDSPSGCLTDELHGDFTDEELTHLINRRNKVREFMAENLHRNEKDILYVPVVFHNLYKIVGDEPIHSYCDYITGTTKPLEENGEILKTNFAKDGDYVSGNDQNICNQRIVRSIEILNAQYYPSGVQFILHPDYDEMQHDTISGYDGFFDNATGDNLPNANDLKIEYNIPNALNIYTTDCLGTGPTTTGYTTCKSGLNGYSTYPWILKGNEPGIFIIHKEMPGSDDTTNPNISTLAHEIGHFFSLLHINGVWFWEGNIPRELVEGSDCDIHGDLICDTPGSPGNETTSSWYIDSTEGECIYHGYGGEYDDNTDTLKIGGYNNISPISVNYNYCEKWNYVNPYGLEHCESYTNYDNIGNFFGTREVECTSSDSSKFATECHIDNYFYYDLQGREVSSLPIGHNFMGPVTLTQDCAQVGHPDYDNTKNGFTDEQFANINKSLDLDYTSCSNEDACNFGLSISKGVEEAYLLRSGESSCLYPCDKQESANYYEQFHPGCLISDAEYQLDFSQYDCSENLLSLNQNIIPHNFGIHQIYPNPFNPIITIDYGLKQNSDIKISIYNINGRLITTLINEFQIAGYHSIIWDASSYSSGIYFLNISSDETFETKKMVLIK